MSENLVLAASNKHCGVYIYLDEVGMLKGLPPNRRASGIAKTCGFDDAQFFGGFYVCLRKNTIHHAMDRFGQDAYIL